MDELAEQFESHREHLNRVAYRMLGSTGEAEDAVQEAWLRLGRSDADAVANLGGWLTTVVARVCLDLLRARRARREQAAGAWLPEPVVSVDEGPEEQALPGGSAGRHSSTARRACSSDRSRRRSRSWPSRSPVDGSPRST